MKTAIRELIGKAVTNKKLTMAQGTTLIRHRKHHTEGHVLHEHAMKQVGK